MSASPSTDALERAFRDHERQLWAHCYRMTGSAADADDVVQDAFARVLERPPSVTRSLYPWLLKVATNLSIDRLRRRRRTYVGPWLPTPLEASEPAGAGAELEPPDARYDRLESLGHAFLVALEALTPQQRAVLLLRDVAGYSVRETADALETSDGAVKVALHRARRAMGDYDEVRRAMSPVSAQSYAAARRALERFVVALASDDPRAMEALLREDAYALNDGGGVVNAARVPVRGREKVVRFYRRLAAMATIQESRFTTVNGAPAVVVRYAAARPGWPTAACLQARLDAQGRIAALDTLVEPGKIAPLCGGDPRA